ncbi:hypothetical protein CSZ94_11000 [Janthinobacterium sp. ROICE36]|uniref:hypothetical protein n=1 Tax=Janthinobacterium sp. ROICE36 TaxID=2048670 RepID=UPI000C7ED763|nr:hypothetical protein [Janthinobacterium sp. ROICE36]PLY42328.1 hypothetical protein CSZ94_11000 [Janthinobacterium sp. ROICE36]
MRDNFKSTPNTAKRYAALMSRLFKFIIGALGLRQDKRVDQLDMSSYKTGRREVRATHAQVQAIREAGMMSKERKGTGLGIPTASGPMFACIIDMSYLLWARGIDIRMLKESQIEDGRIRIKPSKTQKTSGKAVDIVVTPEIAEMIARARGLKIKYGLISQYVFPTQKGGAYTRSGLSSRWDRAKERIGMKDDVVFRDRRALVPPMRRAVVRTVVTFKSAWYTRLERPPTSISRRLSPTHPRFRWHCHGSNSSRKRKNPAPILYKRIISVLGFYTA